MLFPVLRFHFQVLERYRHFFLTDAKESTDTNHRLGYVAALIEDEISDIADRVVGIVIDIFFVNVGHQPLIRRQRRRR